ncbi:hypothetical protein [Tissierella creatinophila]|uniref:Antirestriction protein (ArdA) n=1 Tax=Tissierella creatinophila DSM 6911 TaxID=1123403 RepID=A0A1U7M8N4_TISCR|nr:hypothetical protein [Tissierella creatinophila]OLS03558.1 hypothetical protein TICRE_04150 [Tissierella creatinophila DSM 6911]
MKNLDDLINSLEKNQEELEYLQDRFKELSVKERSILEGAVELNKVNNAADLINITEQLYRFDYYHNVADERSLGEYVAKYKEHARDEALKFINTEKLGREYHEDFQGTFTNKGYVIPRGIIKQIYDGTNIDELSKGDWAVKLKLSSKHNHEGVWVNLPDYERSTGELDELELALDSLGIEDVNKAKLEDVKCILPNIKDLIEQYESIEELIIDGNNLGYLLDESYDDKDFFLEHFKSAMELENCTRLDYALDISQNLDCYDYLPKTADLERYGRFVADRDKIVKDGTILGDNFDYVKYAKADIEKEELVSCKYGFIKRNDEKFHYQLSKEPANISLLME